MSSPAPGLSKSQPAATIDDVVDRLSAIIQWASANDSRLGYFPALYRKVTLGVRDGIQEGIFDDGARMERFDVIFANRYLEAFHAYRAGGSPSMCWRLAFRSAGDYWPIVVQHLILGINAHINLDLGIAAAATMRGRELEDIHRDFDRINGILASLVAGVQNELAEIWKLFALMNRFLGSVDDAIINFSMHRARDEAWRSAQRFSALPDDLWPEAITRQDRVALAVGNLVRYPGPFLAAVTRIIRLGEVQSNRKVIEILS